MANEAQQAIQMTAVQGQPILVKVSQQKDFWESYQVPISSFLLLLTACIAWIIQLHVANKNHGLELLKFKTQQFADLSTKLSTLTHIRLEIFNNISMTRKLEYLLENANDFPPHQSVDTQKVNEDIVTYRLDQIAIIARLTSAYIEITSSWWMSDSQKTLIENDINRDTNIATDADANFGDRYIYDVCKERLEVLGNEIQELESTKKLDPLTSLALYILDKLESQRGA